MRALTSPLLVLLLTLAAALPAAGGAPQVAIVIDDVGDSLPAGRRSVRLPGPVALAFLPQTPHASELAEAAHARGKEVLLHQPMQAVARNALLGPGAVTMHMTRRRFLETLRGNLQGLPHVSGLNNHMGSLLTRHPGHMTWLMQELKRQGGLFYIDSRTTKHTVAEQMANEVGVPVIRRHVFLDNEPEPAAIRDQLRELVRRARDQGYALAIGHPYPATLAVLEAELPRLAEAGVELVPVRALIQRSQPEGRTWHASSSP